MNYSADPLQIAHGTLGFREHRYFGVRKCDATNIESSKYLISYYKGNRNGCLTYVNVAFSISMHWMNK